MASRRYTPHIVSVILILIAAIGYLLDHGAGATAPSVRTTLPVVTAPAGTLSLITEPDQGTAPVLALIAGATKSIDLVMYEFKDVQIEEALAKAEARGVTVRVLLDHGYYGAPDDENNDAYAYLGAHGVAVEWTPATFALTHQKTMIVDDRQALIMTFNFTPEYYSSSRDFGIVDADAQDVKAVEDTFSDDWKSLKEPNELGTDLVWSPGSQNDMLLIIDHATKTLDVYNEEMQDPAVISALETAAKRGVAVHVVMTYDSTDKVAFAELSNAGVSVKTFADSKTALYIHAKVIIADGTEAFLGSENFSTTSLGKNRELGLFVSDPTILSSLEATFAGDYAAAKIFIAR